MELSGAKGMEGRGATGSQDSQGGARVTSADTDGCGSLVELREHWTKAKPMVIHGDGGGR